MSKNYSRHAKKMYHHFCQNLNSMEIMKYLSSKENIKIYKNCGLQELLKQAGLHLKKKKFFIG